MKRFRKIPLVGLAVVLAVFLPGVGGAGESVLCFGADGHVAVEAPASPGACFSKSMGWETSTGTPGRELSRKADHCGPCADLPDLSGPWANTAFSWHVSEEAAWPAMSPSTAFLQGHEIPASAGEAAVTVRPYAPAGSPLAYLRTTVLLI